MEITESLKQDLQSAPDWFHKSIAILPRKENFLHAAGNLKYQVWDRANAKNIVVLIHGTGAHKKWWDPIAPLINEDFTVIAPDLPGMGESDHRNAYNFEEFSEALIAIINQEKIVSNYQKIYLVGHSLGGHVAGFVATEEKDLIDGLMIVDTFIRPPNYDNSEHKKNGPLRMIKYYDNKESLLQRFRLMPKQDCENDWYLRYIAEHSIKNTQDGWRWKFDDKMFTGLERLFGYKFSFNCPAVFVHGENSLLTSGKLLENAKRAYSDKMQFINVEGAAHHVPLDNPIELIELILKKSKI